MEMSTYVQQTFVQLSLFFKLDWLQNPPTYPIDKYKMEFCQT